LSYGDQQQKRLQLLKGRTIDLNPESIRGSVNRPYLFGITMKGNKQMKTTTNIISSAIAACAFACLMLSPGAQAVSPAPDGGYPGGNTAEGQNALSSLTSGTYNTAGGFFSLRGDTTGNFNTAFGAGALFANNADQNSAFGALALLSNAGPANSAFGYGALASNTANANAAFGAYALLSNTSGNFNTATGFAALQSNTTGVQNTAVGSGALLLNTEGNYNTAVGVNALLNNITGSPNTAFGWGALNANTTGFANTAVGYQAAYNNAAGSNTAVGYQALLSGTLDHNTAIGSQAGSSITGSYDICIGAAETGVAGQDYTTRIGSNLPITAGASACYIGGINAQAVDPATATAVYVDGTNKLGTIVSSQRFKKDIQSMDKASEAILALKPVTFHYKTDTKNIPCFGLIAEEVANTASVLVVRDKEGKPYTVRYDQVNVMLLNEFLKEHRKVQELAHGMATLTAQLKEQAIQIQRVSAKLELQKQATRKFAVNRR
jgi:hypothetical protein